MVRVCVAFGSGSVIACTGLHPVAWVRASHRLQTGCFWACVWVWFKGLYFRLCTVGSLLSVTGAGVVIGSGLCGHWFGCGDRFGCVWPLVRVRALHRLQTGCFRPCVWVWFNGLYFRLCTVGSLIGSLLSATGAGVVIGSGVCGHWFGL